MIWLTGWLKAQRCPGMEAKALCADTALWRGRHLLAEDGLQGQHFLAPGPKYNAVGVGRRLQGPERGI
jgi:hypothetical protein